MKIVEAPNKRSTAVDYWDVQVGQTYRRHNHVSDGVAHIYLVTETYTMVSLSTGTVLLPAERAKEGVKWVPVDAHVVYNGDL